MKKICLVLLSLIFVIMVFVACEKEDPSETETVYYTVSFHSNGGTAVESVTVVAGGTILAPDEPTRENYIFTGWTLDGKSFVFDYTTVESDITLNAEWKSADDIFRYEPIAGSDSVRITSFTKEYKTMMLPNNINGFRVSAVGDGVFASLSSENVTRIIIPDTITEIGARAFAECSGIEFAVNGKLTYVGEKAFYACNGLKEVAFGEGLLRVGSEAFAGTSITTVLLPQSTAVVEENAFAYCRQLLTVLVYADIADSAYAIEDGVFRDCTSLRTVFVYGNEDDGARILQKTASGNECFEEATFSYYAETDPEREGSYWYWHNGEPRIW